jgi:uncharacterized protein (DUF934 family)
MMNVVRCEVVVERIFGVGEKKKESVRGSVRNILTRHGQLRRNVSINLAVWYKPHEMCTVMSAHLERAEVVAVN